jgi:Zn-finger nucleic acid-binding protein
MKEAELGAGIFVDQCTVCQGIFLDSGEMQEILLQNETERFQMRRKILTMNVGETR